MNSVQKISYDEAHPWILHKHYAKRIPSITHAYGVYEGGFLTGVVTFGMAPNYLLPTGLFGSVVGEQFKKNVLELNRLVVDTESQNIPSQLIAGAFRLLPQKTVVVSYADSGMGHLGYVYQATNWLYTGKTVEYFAKVEKEGRHTRHATTKATHKIKKTAKYRYVYFVGPKKWKKKMTKLLKYPILPYPKGDTSRYDDTYQPKVQMVMF